MGGMSWRRNFERRKDRNTKRARRKNIGEIEAVVRDRGRGQETDIGDDQDQRVLTQRLSGRDEGRGRGGRRRKNRKRRKRKKDIDSVYLKLHLTSIVKLLVYFNEILIL